MYKMVVLLSVGIFLYAETYRVSGVMSNDDLSVRSAPGVSFKKIDALSYDAKHIEVLECTNTNYVKHKKWCRIKHKSSTGDIITGWVSARYLSLEKESDESNEDRYIETDSTPLLNSEQNVQISKTDFQKSKKQLELGNTLYYLRIGHEKDSVKYYKKAIELGSDLAVIQLAKMYYNGTGVLKDKNKALKMIEDKKDILLKKVNIDKDPFAIYLLGYLHQYGIGFNKDIVKAYHYYKEAAKLGSIFAQNNLGTILDDDKLNNPKIPYDIEEALNWYKLAAMQGNPLSMGNIGKVYEYNKGDYFNEKNLNKLEKYKSKKKRLKKALKWFKDASLYGDKYSIKEMKKIEDELFDIDINIHAEEDKIKYKDDILYIRNFELPGVNCDKPSDQFGDWTDWKVENWKREALKYNKCLEKAKRKNINAFNDLRRKVSYKHENGKYYYSSYLIKQELDKKREKVDSIMESIEYGFSWLEDEVHSIEGQIEYQNKQNRRNNEMNRYLNEMQQYGSPYGNSYILPGMR